MYCFKLLLILLLSSFFSAQAELKQGVYVLQGKQYNLEIAQTQKELLKGLMGRSSLAHNQGMLLVFPEFKLQGIWMKNVQIPLTVAWLNEAYQVIDVKQLQPCQQAYCPVYFSSLPARFVLELAAHSSIKLGDQLYYQP